MARSLGKKQKEKLANLHSLYFYFVHAFLLVWACVAYLFYFHPEILDWSRWIAVLLVLLWTVYNSPPFAKVIGYKSLQSYRRLFLRRFTTFKALSVFALIAILGIGFPMFKELSARFKYVDMIKRMTLVEGSEEIPFPGPGDLAAAFNLYPHRREVPFILVRMARLLSFDDQTSNYNKFVAAFWRGIDVNSIIAKYKDKKTLERYKGAIDPIIFLSRLMIEARHEGEEDLNSLKDAIALLNTYRRDDALADIYRMIYEHEIIEGQKKSKCSDYLQLKKRITQLLDEIRDEESPRKHVHLVSSSVFQELLDHYALLQIDLAAIKIKQGVLQRSITECKEKFERGEIVLLVPELYMRILTMRRKIANSSDVPWLEGPGKLSIYQYFKHQVGRQTALTNHIMALFGRVPGLQESMKKRIFDAEAFREFRNLETWDMGTPMSASFAGTSMRKKMVEWLKSGW